MTTTELLILSDADIVKLLLAHWKLPSLDAIEFTGFYKPNYKGGLGTLEDLCLVAPTDQPEPFPYSMPFGHEFRPVFHPAAVDNDLQPMQAGQAYRFSVRLSKPTRTPRTDPFALISKNVRPCTGPEHQRRVEELLRIGSSGPKKTQRQLAAALEQMGSSMYLEPNRFLFELLQNADDYPDPKFGNEVRVNLRLLNDYILFQHNGLPFLYRNVESLADVGNSTKTNERETTGYKGIGFKSVFGVSKWVYLRSNKYTFCFADEGNSAEPWHTWPRWTAKLPSDLANDPQFSDERRYVVSFALRIDSSRVSGSAGYAAVLQSLLARPQFALFLRHLSELAIEGVDLPFTRLRRTLDQHTKRTIFQVGDEKNEYSVTSYDIAARSKLDELVKAGVAAEKSFPEKLRDAHTVKIWFAARFNQEGGLESLPASEAPLFSYLPTNDTSYGLPLLVNADFILAPNRVQVQSHHLWNAFLFHQIGLHLIQWIADQVKADASHARNIYPFIPAKQSANPNQEALNAGIQEGINSIRCLPSADSAELKLVSEAVLDEPGLYNLLPTLYHGLLNDGLTVIRANAKASVEAADLMGRFNLHIIDWDKFKKIFSHSDITKFYGPADAVRLLQHFATDKNIVTAEWQPICWLFDQHGEMVAPNEKALYGELSEKWDPDFPLAADVRYLHPELQQLLRANLAIATWIKDGLGIAPYSRAQIVRDRLISYVCKPVMESSVRDQCIQYLYHLHRRLELQKWLTETERSKLAKMFVLCDDGKYRHVDICYLSHHYKPPFELEVIAEEIGKAQFPLVSKDYLQIYPEPQGWHEFWSYCNIPTPNAADLLKTTLLPVGVQVSAWTSAKHEAVLRLAIDAFTKGQTFPHTELGKLKARTVSGTAALAECVLPLAYNPHLALLDKLPIPLIPANTLATDYFATADPGAVVNFFQAGGCKPWDESTTLTYASQQLLTLPLDFGASVAAVRQLYEWDQNKKMAGTHKNLLKALPLYQKDGSTRPANSTFFSSIYEPEHDVEKLTGGQQQQVLSPDYIPAQASASDLNVWSRFFEELGVVGKFAVKSYEKISYTQARELYPTYIKWVDANPEICPAPHSGYKHRHSFQHLYLINNPELVSNTLIAEIIAHIFSAVEKNIKQKPPSVYHTSANNTTWPAGSLLCGFPLVPCSGTPVLRPAHEVYSKHLAAVPAGFPIATVSYGSLELEQRLGLRTQLSPDDALQLLADVAATATSGQVINDSVKLAFSKTLSQVLPWLTDKTKVSPVWRAKLLLPAADGTWTNANQTHLVTRRSLYLTTSGAILLDFYPTVSGESYRQFATALGIPLLTEKEFKLAQVATADIKLQTAQVLQRLDSHHLFDLLCDYTGLPISQVARWKQSFSDLVFSQVPALQRECTLIPGYRIESEEMQQIEGKSFYYVGHLWSACHWQALALFLKGQLELPVPTHVIIRLLESNSPDAQAAVFAQAKLPIPARLQPPPQPPVVKIQTPELPPTTQVPQTPIISIPSDSPSQQDKDDAINFSESEDDEFTSDTSLSPEEQKIFHEQACKAAVEWLQTHDYSLPAHIEELFSVLKPVVAPDGKTLKIVVRSALNGRLFFHVHEWAELCEPDTLLLLFCRHEGAKPSILVVPNPAEQLVLDNPNTYVRVPNSPLNAAVLHLLATDIDRHSPEFRYIFLHLPGPGAPPINLAHRRVEEVLTADTSFAI